MAFNVWSTCGRSCPAPAMGGSKQFREMPLNMVAAGSVGSLCVGALNPLDTVRIRWQIGQRGSSSSIYSFFRDIVVKEGLWRGLWRPGCTANMAAICGSTGFRIGVYPTLREGITELIGTNKNPLVRARQPCLCRLAFAFSRRTPIKKRTGFPLEVDQYCTASFGS